MRLFHATDILWDTDNELQEGLGLPSSAYVHAEDEDDIADALSDELGYCIKSLNTEECNETLVFVS